MKRLQAAQRRSNKLAGNADPTQLTRRTFVKLGAMAAVAGLLPRVVFGSSKSLAAQDKSLAFYNTHTGEKLKAIYWAEGNYVDATLREINYILRDPRNNEVRDIDTGLLDFLFAVRQEVDGKQPFHVISGYRSPATNSFLRAHSSGVAENSLHLVGKAIDIRMPGRDTRSLQKAAKDLRLGGVGYYPKSDFIHVDIGRVRYW